MKFSLQWLRKYLDLNLNAEKLAEQLTNIGLEVEEVSGDELEIAVPPNRADCLGVIGIAREVAAVNGVQFMQPIIKPTVATIDDQIKVDIQNTTACPRYYSRVLKGIDNTKTTPQWIQDCLTVAGVNIISPVVDITNFVMLEWGQPLHAFDLSKIADQTLIVRNAKVGETLKLLDETPIRLDPKILIIADTKQPLALAGIKGGLDSGITTQSRDIVLECAYFEPVQVRLASRNLGVQTDGSYRFERAVDPTMQSQVMERITQLLLETVGGNAGPIVVEEDLEMIPESLTLGLRYDRIKRIVGIEIPLETVKTILINLGMQVEPSTVENDLIVTVPDFRTDIQREIDLIEEVVRIYGYNNIPAQLPIGTLEFTAQPEELVSEERILNCLINRGYNEAITYSFIDPDLAAMFFPAMEHTRQVTNPIASDMSLMRPTLLPALVSTVVYNQNRQQNRLKFCEIGLRFAQFDDNLEQVKTIAGVSCGTVLPEGWGNVARPVDLFDIKADVTALFKLAHNDANLDFRPIADVALHPGQSAGVYLGNAKVGKLGALHPALQEQLGLTTPVYMFELDYVAVVNGRVANFSAFSKYPAIRRDLAILVAKEVSSAKLVQLIEQTIGNLLQNVVIFDVYEGKGIEPGFKSMGLGLTLQNLERTLTDVEVTSIFERVIAMLEKEFNAKLR